MKNFNRQGWLSRTAVSSIIAGLFTITIFTPEINTGGIVSQRNVETGQVVQPGQPLLAVVPLEDVWVTANFKESQLAAMRPGQPVTIKVDAYDGRTFFRFSYRWITSE